jgi:hypothetical protein
MVADETRMRAKVLDAARNLLTVGSLALVVGVRFCLRHGPIL